MVSRKREDAHKVRQNVFALNGFQAETTNRHLVHLVIYSMLSHSIYNEQECASDEHLHSLSQRPARFADETGGKAKMVLGRNPAVGYVCKTKKRRHPFLKDCPSTPIKAFDDTLY